MRHFISAALLALLSLSPIAASAADEPAIFSTRAGAIRGYDPVAYFTEGKALKGSREIRFRWRDADWSFISEEHRDLFRADPIRYAPNYGGYCAYAMSKGYYAKTDPDAWTVHEGRLYLNFSDSVREIWRKDIPGNVDRADANWKKLRAEVAESR